METLLLNETLRAPNGDAVPFSVTHQVCSSSAPRPVAFGVDGVHAVKHTLELVLDDPETFEPTGERIAVLQVKEIPAMWVSQAQATWFDVLDCLGGDWLQLIPFVKYAQRKEPLTLIDGSLFLLAKLRVAPEYRGQELGNCLIARAMQILGRSTNDVFVAIPAPIADSDDAPRAPQPPEACIALMRYYQRLGLTAYRPKSPDRLVYHLACHYLPWERDERL